MLNHMYKMPKTMNSKKQRQVQATQAEISNEKSQATQAKVGKKYNKTR